MEFNTENVLDPIQNHSIISDISDFDENQIVYQNLKNVYAILSKRNDSDIAIEDSLPFLYEFLHKLSESDEFENLSQLYHQIKTKNLNPKIPLKLVILKLEKYAQDIKNKKGLNYLFKLLKNPQMTFTYLEFYQICEMNISIPENLDNEAIKTFAAITSFDNTFEQCDFRTIQSIKNEINKEIADLANLANNIDTPGYIEKYEQHTKIIEQLKIYLSKVLYENKPKHFITNFDRIKNSIKKNIDRSLKELSEIDDDLCKVVKKHLKLKANEISYSIH